MVVPFQYITSNASEVTASTDLLKTAQAFQAGEATVVTGAPPCEPFSTAGARNGFQDHRADAVHSFIRDGARYLALSILSFEEVSGFLRAAKRAHIVL